MNSWWETPSQELAYLFGLSFADGHAKRGRNGNQIGGMFISQKDRAVLDRLVDIAPGGCIHQRRSGADQLWQAYFRAGDGPSVETMRLWSIVPNKTEYGHWPREALTQEMLPHYIRGFFDGDGCIVEYKKKNRTESMIWRISFVCHLRHYLQDLQEALESLGVLRGRIRQDGRNHRLEYSAFQPIGDFVRAIYDSATVYMQHKRDRADRFLRYTSDGDRRVGEMNPGSKLTESDVRTMREMRDAGMVFRKISEQFGVTTTQAARICQRKYWTHVA